MSTTLTMTFGQRLRYAREACGLKQADLAVKLGVSRSAIANWENDEHSPAPLYRREMAHLLERPTWFFGLENMSFSREVIQGYRPRRLVPLPNVA